MDETAFSPGSCIARAILSRASIREYTRKQIDAPAWCSPVRRRLRPQVAGRGLVALDR